MAGISFRDLKNQVAASADTDKQKINVADVTRVLSIAAGILATQSGTDAIATYANLLKVGEKANAKAVAPKPVTAEGKAVSAPKKKAGKKSVGKKKDKKVLRRKRSS